MQALSVLLVHLFLRLRRGGRVAVLLAALGGGLLFGAAPNDASAQTPTVIELVTNTHLARGASNSDILAAQAFTTGSNSGGYTLSSVDLGLARNPGTSTTVTIQTNRNRGTSDANVVATLTAPTTALVQGVNRFTAPANTTLAANTTYHVVLNSGSNRVFFMQIDHNGQRGEPGWSIANVWYNFDSGRNRWQADTSNFSIGIGINGYANPSSGPVTITESDGSTTVTEAAGTGNSDTYTVVLSSMPTNTVTITVTAPTGLLVDGPDTSTAGTSSETLTFSNTDWNTAQTVTVFGVDDSTDQGTGRTLDITHAASSSDTDFNNIDIDDVSVTLVDNDNGAPTFASATLARSVAENSAAGTNVGTAIPVATDPDGDALTYTMAGADAASFAFNAATRQISTRSGVTYNHEAKSAYTVTVTASDGSLSGSVTVNIAVTDVAGEAPASPAAPSVTATSGSATSLDVTWTAPTNTGPAITDYDVQYRVAGGGTYTSWAHTGTATSTTITGLTADTAYQVRVRATNAEGTSGWSSRGSGRTATATPNRAPTFASATLARSVAENSAVGTNVGTAIPAATDPDGDTLTYTMGGTDAASFDFNASTRQITTKTNVTYDHETKSSYTVTVTASDGSLSGSVTVNIAVTDVSEPPDAPVPTARGVRGSTTSLSVSWTAPANAGRPAITDYDVQYREGTSGAWTTVTHTGTATTATITGLTADTAYQVQVRATNAEGTSDWSTAVQGNTNARVPGTLQTREVPENSAIGTNVGAAIPGIDPVDNPGLTNFAYSLAGADAASFAFNAATRQITTGAVFNHEDEDEYEVTIVATSDTTIFDIPVEITVTDVNEPPPAPAAPTVTTSSTSNTGLSVSWTAPTNTGPAITDYDVQYRQGTSGAWTAVTHTGTATTATITGLPAGSSHQVQVRATNAEGTSDWSPAGTGTTGSDPVFASATQTRSVAENSAAGTNVGTAIPAATDADMDTLTYSMTGTDAASFAFNATTRQITTGAVFDHEAKSAYTVTVTATDGRGTASVTVTITVTDVAEPPSAPAAPTVTATSGTTDSLDVSWTAPVNTGKPAITDYDVQYRAGTSGAWTSVTHTGTATSATITGLTPGTAYQVQVRAANAEGTSDWSPAGGDSTSLPVITISGGSSVTEGANASFTVTASPAPASNLDISVTVTDAAHGDFVAAANKGAQTVTITAGSSTASYSIATVNDSADEPGGRVTVTLVDDSGYTLGSTTSAGVGVADNDPTTVTLSTPDTTATEGSTDTASITVTLNRGMIEAANEAVDVPLSFSSGTAGTDFTLALQGSPTGVTFTSSTNTLRFAASSGAVSAASATLTLTAVTDTDRTDESVTVSLGAPDSTTLTANGGFTTSRTGDGVIALLEDVTTTTSGAYITRKVIPSAGVTRDGQGGWTLEEGTEIKVRFTNLQSPTPSTPITVNYYVTERNPYIYHIAEEHRGYRNVTIAANQKHADLTIPTRASSSEYEKDENPLWVLLMSADPRETPRAYWTQYRPLQFTITKASGGGMNSPQQEAVEAATEVTISTGAASAAEGGTVTYTLSADPAPSADLTVEVLVEEEMGAGSDAVGSAQVVTATIPAGQTSATVTVNLMSDDVARADGTVSATIMTGDGYAAGDQDAVTLALVDDDTPASNLVAGGSFETPTVTAHDGTWHQFAAGTAGIEWTVTGGPLELMRGILGGASDGAQHAELDSTGSVTISQALATVAGRTYTVSFDHKARPGTAAYTNGLTATWNGADIAAGITLGSAWRTHTVQVVGTGSDTLSFTDSGRSDGVGTFLDNVSVTPAPAQQQQTQTLTQTPVVSISGGGGITEGGTASFTITATPAPTTPIVVKVGVSQSGSFGASGAANIAVSGASTTYTISTTDDTLDEPDGSVTATLKDGSGYTVSSTSGAATVSVSDNDVPVLSISGGGAITEGGTASFTITASSVPASPITVNIGVSQNGAFGASGTATVTVSGASTTYTISTADDSTDEPDGSVTATLKSGSGYTLLSTADSATVDVADNDAPELSISGGSGITEGGTASFTITASSVPASPITVNVGVSQNGAFGASGAATVTVSGASTTYTISTADDSTDEANGSVTATLKGGSGYTVSSTSGAATVSVSDDDVPELSISGGSSITEGGIASFTITASPVPASPITVNVGVSQNGAFGASGTATITVSGASTTYTISTADDTVDEPNGSVTATLKGGSGYTVSSTSGAATVSVADNDDPPLKLSVSIDNASATEGGYLTFTARLSHASSEQVVVKWNTAYAWDHDGHRARDGDDYEGRHVETLTFAPGVTAQTEKIWLVADDEPEGDEVFAIELFLGEEWKFKPDATGIMTITDGD